MAKENGFITVESQGLNILEVTVGNKVKVKFSDLALNMSQTQDLAALCKSKAQIDLVIRQRENPLFDSE